MSCRALLVAIVALLAAPDGAAGLDPVVVLGEGTNLAVDATGDGRRLVMDLQGTLWRMPGDGGAAFPLTEPTLDARRPRWLPGDRTVIFQAYAEGYWDLWRLAVGEPGAAPEQLTFGAFDDREPAPAPDGESVVFSSDRSGSYDLWRLTLGDGALTQLTFDPGAELDPAVSPDGRLIAFVSRSPDGDRLRVLTPSGLGITVYEGGERLAGPAWRPDGTLLTFVASDGRSSELRMAILSDPVVVKPLTDDEDVFPFPAAWLDRERFVYTADGRIRLRRLGSRRAAEVPFFASVLLERRPWTRKKRVLDGDAERTARGLRAPALAPDGARLALTALGDLWLVDADGSTKQLTRDPALDVDPAWTPDGAALVFASDRDGAPGLWQLTLESGRIARIGGDAGAVRPAVSPDGRRVAYLQTGFLGDWGRADLRLLDLATGETRTLAEGLFAPSAPAWSPDGEAVWLNALERASTRFREGTNRLLRIDVDDGALETASRAALAALDARVTSGPAAAGGRLIASSEGRLRRLPGDEDAPPPKLLLDEPAWSPTTSADGSVVAFHGVDGLRRMEAGEAASVPWQAVIHWRHHPGESAYAIRAGRVLDVVSGRYLEAQDVHVEGQRIVAIVPRGARPLPDRVVDAEDATVIPGLIDMHAHMSAALGERLGRLWLAHGVTAVRETGGDPYDSLERREAWAAGRRPGPRLFHAGALIDGPRVYYAQAEPVTDAERLDTLLDRAAALELDLVKAYVRLPDRLQRRLVEGAHRRGLAVASHELYPAARHGVDAIEHLGATSRRGYSTKQSSLGRAYRDVIELTSTSGMAITPTLGLSGGYLWLTRREPAWLEGEAWQTLATADERQAIRKLLERFSGTPAVIEARMRHEMRTVRELMEAGALVTAGTDVPFVPPGPGLHVELALYVEAGLSPAEALRTATLDAARALGYASELGSIEAGKLADLVVLDGDPLEDIGALRRIRAVVSGGRYLPLDTLLRPSRAPE